MKRFPPLEKSFGSAGRLLVLMLSITLLLGMIPLSAEAAEEKKSDITDDVIDLLTDTIDMFSFHHGFEDSLVWAEDSSGETVGVTMSRSGDKYYAYNKEFNFFVIDGRFENLNNHSFSDFIEYVKDGDDGITRWIKSFCEESDYYGHWIVKDDSKMLRFDDPEWKRDIALEPELSIIGHHDQGAEAVTLARAYIDVASWYAYTFDWFGLCGDGTESVLAIDEDKTHLANNVGYIVIFADPSVADSEEILAHEFCHSVFGLKTGNDNPSKETEALNEGLSDVFAALFQESVLGVDDWVIGRNISSTKYLSRAESIKNGSVTRWPRTMDDFITKTDKNYCHENSGIISYTLYNIWDQVFYRNSDRFGQVLFRSMDYIPANGSFSDFREAFRTAMGLWYSDEKVPQAMTYFDIAKIPPKAGESLTEIWDQVVDDAEENIRIPGKDFPVTLMDLTKLNYGQLSRLNWSGGLYTDWVGGTGKGSWILAANFADENMDLMFNISFDGVLGDESQYPVSIYVTDYMDGRSGYSLDGHNATGMTPSEFGDKDPAQMMDVPYLYNQGCIEIPLDDGWLLRAYFTDPAYQYGAPTILTAAEAMRAW